MFDLPIFPLNTILFPGMPVHLRIFEPRYLRLVQDCLASNQPFGVVLIREGSEALGPLPKPFHIGCTARIIQMDKGENDQVNITGLGDERFQIKRIKHGRPYLTAEVQILPFTSAPVWQLQDLVAHLAPPLRQYLKLISEIGKGEVDLGKIQLPDDPLLTIYLAASLVQIPAVEKLPLLEAGSVQSLVEGLERLYRREVAILHQTRLKTLEDARRAAWSN